MSTIGKEVSEYITKRLQTLQLSEEKSCDTLLELESTMDVYLTQKLKKCIPVDCCEKDCCCPCAEKDLNILKMVCSGDSCTLVPAVKVEEPIVQAEVVAEPAKVEAKACSNPDCKCSPCACENCTCGSEPVKQAEVVEHVVSEQIQPGSIASEPIKEEAVQVQESQPEPVAEPIATPVAEPIAEPVSEPIAAPIAEPVQPPVEQPVEIPSIVEPTAEPVAEPAQPSPPNGQEAAASTA